jgi:hypothetical protein
MTMALALVTELAELLGTSEDEAVAALRVALRQHKAEEARARVAFARAASAPMLQAEREAIDAVIAPLEAAYNERKARHAGLIARLEAAAADIERGVAAETLTEAQILAELEA